MVKFYQPTSKYIVHLQETFVSVNDELLKKK